MQTDVQSPTSPRSKIPVRVRRDSGFGTPPRSRATTPTGSSQSPSSTSTPSRYQQSNIRSTGSSSPKDSPKREPLLIRIPSRQKLQELRSGRRPSLSTGGSKGKEAEQDRQDALARIRHHFDSSSSFGLRAQPKFRLPNDAVAKKPQKKPPFLCDSLQKASIALLADTANTRSKH